MKSTARSAPSGRDHNLLPDAGARPTKKNLAIMERFDREVWRRLEEKGAKCVNRFVPEPGSDLIHYECRRYELETKAGTLVVSSYGNVVYTRFEKSTPEVLKVFPGLDVAHFSTKWNHYYFLMDFDAAIEDVGRWLDRVTEPNRDVGGSTEAS